MNAPATGQHVVVIGGGVAGLSAAFELASAGAHATLVEAEGRIGGKLRTSTFAGRMVDEGADAFLLRVPWAVELCEQFGTSDQLVNPAVRNAYVWSRGELRPLPPQHLGVPTDLDALATTGILSAAGVARARLDLEAPATTMTADRTIASVVEERLGTEVLERLVDPLVGGINAGDTHTLSIDAVAPQIAGAARDGSEPSLVRACLAQQRRALAGRPPAPAGAAPAPIFASPIGGMERLAGWIAAAGEQSGGGAGTVDRMLGRRVEGIEPGPSGAGVWTLALSDGTTVEADAVIAAIPAHALSRLLDPVAREAADTFAAIDHASVAIVTFAFPLDALGRALDASGYLVPRVERAKALTACSWTSAKWAHLRPEAADGTFIVRASAGRAGDPSALDRDDSELVSLLEEDLARTMAANGAPTEVRVTRWPDSFPQYTPGHLDRVDRVEASLPPTLAVAGAALRGVGVPACINSGRRAASRVLAALA